MHCTACPLFTIPGRAMKWTQKQLCNTIIDITMVFFWKRLHTSKCFLTLWHVSWVISFLWKYGWYEGQKQIHGNQLEWHHSICKTTQYEVVKCHFNSVTTNKPILVIPKPLPSFSASKPNRFACYSLGNETNFCTCIDTGKILQKVWLGQACCRNLF